LQAAHMTGGLYLRCRTPNAMLQYLLTCFACSRATRALLQQPRSKGLTFRATCFCHRRVIEVGFVCSACLSVFCSPQRECMTCGTEFGKVGKLLDTAGDEPAPAAAVKEGQ
jgi:transcription initiation factor TFIIH subunit 3